MKNNDLIGTTDVINNVSVSSSLILVSESSVNPLEADKMKGANRQILDLFHFKSNFLLHQDVFAIREINMIDFVGLVFNRDTKTDVEAEPFEEINSKEYLLWKEQDHKRRANRKKGEPLPNIDYSGYHMWRYNAIALYREKEKSGKIVSRHRILLKDDFETWTFLKNRQFAIMAPITYVGRNMTRNNARYLWAFAIDLDGVGERQMRNVIHQMTAASTADRNQTSHAPVANIIVNSGHGLHLYYLLEHPIALYEANIELLGRLKQKLTNVVWNFGSSSLKDIQCQGIFQGFRLPQTKTKFGENIRAFSNEDAEYHTIRELNAFCNNELTEAEVKQLEGIAPMQLGVTIDEAGRRWPEWYEKVIVLGDKTRKLWTVKRALYDWWLRRLKDKSEKIVCGHRYFCLFTLAVYAAKCGIDEGELKRDAYSLLGRMEILTTDDDNHFTKQDIDDALKAYNLSYCTYSRDRIEWATGLKMPVNRRNGRKQDLHLKIARSIRDIACLEKGKEQWWDGGGRPTATIQNSKEAQLVWKWFEMYGGTKNNVSQCARETGLDRKTARKWLNVFVEIARAKEAKYEESRKNRATW